LIFVLLPEKICVPMRSAIRVFREELVKAARALAATYRMLKEIDARTMEIFIALIGRTK